MLVKNLKFIPHAMFQVLIITVIYLPNFFIKKNTKRKINDAEAQKKLPKVKSSSGKSKLESEISFATQTTVYCQH